MAHLTLKTPPMPINHTLLSYYKQLDYIAYMKVMHPILVWKQLIISISTLQKVVHNQV